MSKGLDYAKLGLKSGLEIHQQLDSSKLFCDCPSLLRSDEPDFEIHRKLHAVAGESGDVDEAAKYQASLDNDFVYQGYDTTCLVELDEEPPHEINKDALKIALQISFLLNAKIIPITQIMRKTVINGSNTSGFQRTVMIARDGYVETSKGKVGIEAIFLEEDSARTVDETNKKVIYRLDRLGIPLVEIATSPDIKDAEHAKETALKIGEILRSCKVKRGIGTIRQDINISLKGGNRVELKGFQDPKIMIRTFENEVKRQLKLINSNKKWEPEVRRCLSDGTSKFLRPMPGASRMYPETDLPLLKISKDFIDETKKHIPKLKSEVEEELKKQGLNQDMIKLLLSKNKLDDFKVLVNVFNDPNFVAKVLLIFTKEIASHKSISPEKFDSIFSIDLLENVFENLKKGKISKLDIKHVLEKIAGGESFEEAIKIEKEDENVIEEKIRKIILDKPNLSEKAYMGLVMKEFKGKVDGKKAMEIIRKFLK